LALQRVPGRRRTAHSLRQPRACESRAVQGKAVDFAWPPGNVVFKIQGAAKPAKKDQKARKKDIEQAKKLARQKDMDELFPSKGSKGSSISSPKFGDLKPVRFPEPPGGMVTEGYMTGLIAKQDRDS